MLPRQPRTVVVTFARWRMVSLFTAPQRFVADIFIPGIRMELSDSKGPVSQTRHCARQIRSATPFHFSGLSRRRLWFYIAEGACGCGFTSCTDRVPRWDANRTRCVCIGKADSPAHEPVEVGRGNVRITERSDSIESLLIRHDEQYVGPGQ